MVLPKKDNFFHGYYTELYYPNVAPQAGFSLQDVSAQASVFLQGQKEKEQGEHPREASALVCFALVLLQTRHLPLTAVETNCLARKSSRLIRNSYFLYFHIMSCSLMYSGLKLEGFQQSSWGGSRTAVSGNNGRKIPCWF